MIYNFYIKWIICMSTLHIWAFCISLFLVAEANSSLVFSLNSPSFWIIDHSSMEDLMVKALVKAQREDFYTWLKKRALPVCHFSLQDLRAPKDISVVEHDFGCYSGLCTLSPAHMRALWCHYAYTQYYWEHLWITCFYFWYASLLSLRRSSLVITTKLYWGGK